MANKIEKTVEQTVRPIIEALGMELVEVEYRKRDDLPYITVYIYKEGGTDLDACEAVHRAIDEPLDELDPTGGGQYVLNVSSPGIDRAFKTQRDFERNIGSDVEIKFFSPFEGKKMIVATLTAYREGTITVLYNNHEQHFKTEKLAKVSCAVKFD